MNKRVYVDPHQTELVMQYYYLIQPTITISVLQIKNQSMEFVNAFKIFRELMDFVV